MTNLSAVLHHMLNFVHVIPVWLFTNAELLALFPAVFVIGGLILLTLSYVSWRKYKGEVKQRKKNKSVD